MRSPLSLLTLFFICSGFASLSGQQVRTISGMVTDATSGEALSYVAVRVAGTRNGTYTDDDGYFVLTVRESNPVFEFSMIGYERRYLTLSDPGPHQIKLVTRDINIDPITITGGLQTVVEDQELYLKDYALYDHEIFVLVYNRNNNAFEIALVDEDNDIIAQIPGPEKPVELVTDCYGNVHALGKEFDCQLYRYGDEIRYYRDSIDKFRNFVEPCLATIGPFHYYSYTRFNNQWLSYYVQNAISGDGQFFIELEDDERIYQLQDPHPSNPYAGLSKMSKAEMAYLPDEFWERFNKANKDVQFYSLAFFKPLNAPLRTINGQIYIFDHHSGLLRRHRADGMSYSEIEIDYHERKDFGRTIIVDKERGEAYTTYEKNGWTTLAEVDLETGDIVYEWEMPRKFIGKLRVRDGVAYFLYREANYDDTKRLYRLRLKDPE